jgi:hypothetical protein
LASIGGTIPDLDGAESSVKSVIGASHRVSQIFDNIRSLFGRAELKKERLDMNSLTLEVLRVLEFDLEHHGINTNVELSPKLPRCHGSQGSIAGSYR